MLPGMELWRAVSAQPSGSVERRFHDQQLRDQLQELDRRQKRNGQERWLTPIKQPAFIPTVQPPTTNFLSFRQLRLRGDASLPEAEQRRLQKRFEGQPITPDLLEELRRALVITYDNRKILAVVASPKSTANGDVVVPILEARLGQVVVEENDSPIRSKWARDTVLASLQPRSVLRLDKLESALIKLNDLAGVRASGTLKPGAKPGSSDVVITLKAAKRYTTKALAQEPAALAMEKALGREPVRALDRREEPCALRVVKGVTDKEASKEELP